MGMRSSPRETWTARSSRFSFTWCGVWHLTSCFRSGTTQCPQWSRPPILQPQPRFLLFLRSKRAGAAAARARSISSTCFSACSTASGPRRCLVSWISSRSMATGKTRSNCSLSPRSFSANLPPPQQLFLLLLRTPSPPQQARGFAIGPAMEPRGSLRLRHVCLRSLRRSTSETSTHCTPQKVAPTSEQNSACTPSMFQARRAPSTASSNRSIALLLSCTATSRRRR
mmetsp:Transcript_5589/g.17880  ORF Transcript_5589/g.17880 Transcript_5589/m.17880 type:complete len:226 (-) Transcript_5589:1265-1942(-)